MAGADATRSLRRVLLRALVLLVVVAIGCLPAWLLVELDGTEGRRVQIAVEMVRSGNWMVPSLGLEPTWAKPPLHYWLLGGVLRFLGDHPMLLRLPSVLSAAFAAWLAGELLRRWFGARVGWIGALGIACSPLVVMTWPTAEIDPLFASLVAASLCTLATGVARDQRLLVLASGVIGGLAMLQKGPPLFLFGLGAYLVWWRHRRLRHALLHFLPMLAVALCYYVPLWLWCVDPGAMLAVANEESVGRVQFFEWKHVRAIPEFWLRSFAVLLPFGAWCFWEWRGARDARMDAGDLMLRMASGACVVAVVVLTFFPGRATRYILPNVLLFTFAAAPAVAHFASVAGPLPVFARRVRQTIVVLACAALLVLPFVRIPEIGVGAVVLAAIAAVGAHTANSPVRLVAFCLWMPVAAAWTVGLERSLGFAEGRRARVAPATVFARELDRLGVPRTQVGPSDGRPSPVQTIGHFDSPLLLALGMLPPGDELGRRPVASRWVMHEVGGLPPEPPERQERLDADCIERVRLCLPFKTFVLSERRAGR